MSPSTKPPFHGYDAPKMPIPPSLPEERLQARASVRRAIVTGRLKTEPCEVCGASDIVTAHHHDYSRHLDVVWLCYRHHVALHRFDPKALKP